VRLMKVVSNIKCSKAQKLMSDDVIGDLLEVLEMQIGVLVEHIGELDR